MNFAPGDWVADVNHGDVALVTEIVNDHVVRIDHFDGDEPKKINVTLIEPSDPLDHPIEVGSWWHDVQLSTHLEIGDIYIDEAGEAQLKIYWQNQLMTSQTVDLETFIGRVVSGEVSYRD